MGEFGECYIGRGANKIKIRLNMLPGRQVVLDKPPSLEAAVELEEVEEEPEHRLVLAIHPF